ncbi:hypothetical protein [Aureliella helgolandensis]|uniref:Uncharacterized protein n=1 Tax=Aureliella helgolandensis TaxID=2527968 RepID=A0A518GD48_9BACT|nr:hypothetical protein [Aureliella helgolandensis]QDV26521.1 hypothetical protein Q31a_48950 [Aureliella helgolandensis]
MPTITVQAFPGVQTGRGGGAAQGFRTLSQLPGCKPDKTNRRSKGKAVCPLRNSRSVEDRVG